MTSKAKMEQSIVIRNAILDACHYNLLTLAGIAEATGFRKNGLNHHLIILVEDGYLSRHERYARLGGQWASGYSRKNDAPYQWVIHKTQPFVEPPVAPPVHLDIGLMIKLGYTNIIPRAGRVHHGFMSVDPKRRMANE